jgi:hypothetical protein
MSVRLSNAGLLAAWRAYQATWERMTVRRLPRVAFGVVRSGPTWVVLGACGILGLAGRLFYEDAGMGLGLMMLSPVFVSMLSFTLATVRGALGLSGKMPRKMGRAMLRESRCPACGYDISGQPVELDGCVVCSECSAAWLATRVGPEADDRPVEVVISDWAAPSL